MTQQFNVDQDEAVARRAELLVSIVIDNFNYGRFLPEAIDCALKQEYPRTEVIVVDDGSTDNSREIIASYGSGIRPVLKANGGQASALNAGFAASRGEIVIFLDADDILFSQAAAEVVRQLRGDGLCKVQWPMWEINSQGERLGGTRPSQIPPEGDFRQQVVERGPSNVASSPTSGNAWSRSFLERVLPIPEDLEYYKSCADEYLYTLAPVFGRVATIADPLGCYRIHGNNVYSSLSFRQKLEMELSGYDQQCEGLSSVLRRNEILVDATSWKNHSWFHRLDRAVTNILAMVPRGDGFVLVDGGTWGLGREFEGRTVRGFLDHNGVDWGPPADDEVAINRLSTLLEQDVRFLVIAWPSFWWLDEFAGFFERLHQVAECVHRSDTAIIFEFPLRSTESLSEGVMTTVEGDAENA